MAKGIKNRLRAAMDAGYRRMAEHDGSKYARGLASEGYTGGYLAALRDVSLLLNGVEPSDDRSLLKQTRPRSSDRGGAT